MSGLNNNKGMVNEKIDIEKIICSIEMYLHNHTHPEDLTECEQNIMKGFQGPNWMDKWLKLYEQFD